MRLLSSTLLAAQKQASRVPYVKVQVVAKSAGVARPAWTRLYTGSEAESYHAAAMPADGSLLRARVDPATDTLYYQRVTSPGPGSTFSNWTSLGSVAEAGVALCSRGASVLLFSVDTDGVTIKVRESTDNGATFGSPVTAATSPSAVGWLAADYGQDTGTVALFFSASDGVVRVAKRVAGSWGSPSAWSNSLSSITGLACVYNGDWDLAVTGVDSSSNGGLWSCIYGDDYQQLGGTWSPMRQIISSSPGSSVSFRAPFLQVPDAFRLFYVEQYSGTVSYNKANWTATPPQTLFSYNVWREPVPFNLDSTYGLALAYGGGVLWLTMPSGVWQASLNPSPLDLTPDVEEARLTGGPSGSRVRVLLRNDDGRYGSPGAGPLAALTKGAELSVEPGYLTSSGNETSPGLKFWIEGWEHLSEGGRAIFALEAVDGWGLLERWRARRQFAWSAGDKNVYNLLAFALARVGLALSSFSSSTIMNNYYPAFAIHPSESAATAVRRLLAMVPDVLFFRGETGYLKNPQSTDATDYAYGTDHAILRGVYSSRAQQANRVQVFGSGVVNEGLAWSEMEQVGERLRQVHDLNLTSAGAAQDRAQAVLREESIAALQGELAAPTNCGQELYDVVEITDKPAGLTTAKRRVLGLSLQYRRSTPRPQYIMNLQLGGA